MAKLMFFTFPVHIGKTVLDLKKKKKALISTFLCVLRLLVHRKKNIMNPLHFSF